MIFWCMDLNFVLAPVQVPDVRIVAPQIVDNHDPRLQLKLVRDDLFQRCSQLVLFGFRQLVAEVVAYRPLGVFSPFLLALLFVPLRDPRLG